MRSEKAEEAHRIVDRLNAHDPARMAALLHPEFEFFSLLGSVDATTYREAGLE